MAITIEQVDYSNLRGRSDLRDGVGPFDMVLTYPYTPKQFFTEKQFQIHIIILDTPPKKGFLRTFIVGGFTGYLDLTTRQLHRWYSDPIDELHLFYPTIKVIPYSCFKRERHGELGISKEHATILDQKALDNSDFLTVWPGASDSDGTRKEIDYATKKGTDLVCLFKEENPETEFRQRIMESAAVHEGGSSLTFITFGTKQELYSALAQVVDEMKIKTA